ncbi:hypothetical protein CEXT_450901 [Caerostris extrusa]|uniref:Secreted protein n=1 Tax=Caerostris extrusa TaxID=172846 RepID=A0AAV4QIV0_CAEEX|nr:hypothetical protein CEXT_450901 [Caerostris extrusa]
MAGLSVACTLPQLIRFFICFFICIEILLVTKGQLSFPIPSGAANPLPDSHRRRWTDSEENGVIFLLFLALFLHLKHNNCLISFGSLMHARLWPTFPFDANR